MAVVKPKKDKSGVDTTATKCELENKVKELVSVNAQLEEHCRELKESATSAIRLRDSAIEQYEEIKEENERLWNIIKCFTSACSVASKLEEIVDDLEDAAEELEEYRKHKN